MKKILWLGILSSFFFASHTFAAYVLTIPTPTGTSINATMTGSPSVMYVYQLVVQTTPFTTPAPKTNPTIPTTDPTLGTPDAKGVTTWSIPENANTTYYVRVLEWAGLNANTPTYITDPQTVKTGAATVYFSPLTTTQSGNAVIVSGSINTAKQPNYASLIETLTYSTNADLSNPILSNIPSTAGSTAGSYSWSLTGLNPNTPYYAQQTITLNAGNVAVDKIISFNGGTGAQIVPNADGTFTPTANGANSNLNTSSYTLLSGFPGFTVLPDPTLCAQERAAGKAPQFCDLNDVLNYFLKLLIGLSGVVLVLRLMFEGYQYMMSDVPFLKAKSKAGFFAALGGLLLALSAYLILNTINPQLVNESVSVSQLSIGVAGDDGLGVPGTSSGSGKTNRSGGPLTLKLSGGGTATVLPCDPNNNEMQTISVFGGQSVTIQKNLAPSLLRISAAWQAMSPRYNVTSVGGYNCRTIASISTLSYHAYGLAVDINPGTNPVGGGQGDLPASFVQLWTSEGWGWGGKWKSSTDPMHFSKGTNEGGNMTGQ